jgi:hypothetical protein
MLRAALPAGQIQVNCQLATALNVVPSLSLSLSLSFSLSLSLSRSLYLSLSLSLSDPQTYVPQPGRRTAEEREHARRLLLAKAHATVNDALLGRERWTEKEV